MNNAVYVYNLPNKFTEKKLIKVFNYFGDVKKVEIIKHVNILNRYAVIQFYTKEVAKKVLLIDGSLFQGKQLKIKITKIPQSVFSPTLYADSFSSW